MAHVPDIARLETRLHDARGEIARLRNAISNFADQANWEGAKWIGKRHAIKYAAGILRRKASDEK